MKTSIERDQLVHELSMISTKAYLDAYVSVNLDPNIGISFGGSDLAMEALIAYGQAFELLDISIAKE